MNPYIRCTYRRAVSTLPARIRHSNAAGGEPVKWCKEPSVRTPVCAESLCTEKVDRCEAADKEKDDCNPQTGKRRPEVPRRQVQAESGPFKIRLEERCKGEPVEDGPDEHVHGQDKWSPEQQSRTKGSWPEMHLAKHPQAQVLEHDDMTPPAAEPSAQQECRKQCQQEEDETGIHDTVLAELHALARLDRGDGRATKPAVLAAEQPDHDVKNDQELYKAQDDGPSTTHP